MVQSETICIRDLNLCYRAAGSGPDVLFIHGWASSGRMWSPLIEALSDRYRCWAIDLAGFGDSDKPANGWYELPNYTAAVRDFARAVGLTRVEVVGHSMGGMIALDLAATFPGVAQTLTVVNPVVTGRLRVPAAGRVVNGSKASRPLVALARRAWPMAVRLSAPHPVTDWLAARSLWRNDEDLGKASFDSALGGLRAVTQYDTTNSLPRIAVPTLVVVGDRDPVVSPAEGRLAAQRIPGARLTVMRAAHRPFDDRPAEFLAALESFWADSRQAGH